MANRKPANIPKFGEWKDGAPSTPYTVVFDNARTKKTNPNFNPNDPSQFQEVVQERPAAPRPNATPPRQRRGSEVEIREERRYPPPTQPQAYGRPGEDVAVPKFGVWNNRNPDSGYDYTVQFQKVGEERGRQRNPAAATPTHADQTHYSPYKKGTAAHKTADKRKCVIL